MDTSLSLKVERGKGHEVYLRQQHYIQHIIDSHLPYNACTASVPCNSSFLDLTLSDNTPLTSQLYAELIGMLQWVANGTQHDIQFAVNRLSQFYQAPRETHWNAAIHILRYLNSTKNLWLCLGTSKAEPLHGYSNMYWASTSEDRLSTTGWIFKYAGGPISWKSRRQPKVSLYTTEGESMLTSDGAEEVIWLKSLIKDLGVNLESVKMYFDKQGASALSVTDGFQCQTKHINV